MRLGFGNRSQDGSGWGPARGDLLPKSHGPRSKSDDAGSLNHLVVAQLSKTKMCAMQGSPGCGKMAGRLWEVWIADATATEFVPLISFISVYLL